MQTDTATNSSVSNECGVGGGSEQYHLSSESLSLLNAARTHSPNTAHLSFYYNCRAGCCRDPAGVHSRVWMFVIKAESTPQPGFLKRLVVSARVSLVQLGADPVVLPGKQCVQQCNPNPPVVAEARVIDLRKCGILGKKLDGELPPTWPRPGTNRM